MPAPSGRRRSRNAPLSLSECRSRFMGLIAASLPHSTMQLKPSALSLRRKRRSTHPTSLRKVRNGSKRRSSSCHLKGTSQIHSENSKLSQCQQEPSQENVAEVEPKERRISAQSVRHISVSRPKFNRRPSTLTASNRCVP